MSDETAQIALSAYVDFDWEGEADFGDRLILVGNLYPLEGGKPKRDIMVPAGSHVLPLRVNVVPGRYMCELSLPSGDVATVWTAAGPGEGAKAGIEAVAGEVTPVVIDLDNSPHESHSWQYLIGSVEQRDVYFSRRSIAPWAPPEVLWCTFDWGVYSWYKADDRLSLFDRFDWSSWRPVEPIYEGEGTFIYRFKEDGAINGHVGGAGRRRFCAVRTPSGHHLVTIPAPWFDTDTRDEVPVEMMVELEAAAGRSPISVTVRDPRLGSGLAYFATGSLDLAGKMFTNSEDMLYEKMYNPLAAAAGAYVLVGTDAGRGEPTWYRWLENLQKYQDWLPDGKILAATQRLRRAETDRARIEARWAFLEAFESGVPVYTIGLRWLMDGLSRFAGDPDVDAAIATVRRYSYRIDMMQPFVVARLDEEAW